MQDERDSRRGRAQTHEDLSTTDPQPDPSVHGGGKAKLTIVLKRIGGVQWEGEGSPAPGLVAMLGIVVAFLTALGGAVGSGLAPAAVAPYILFGLLALALLILGVTVFLALDARAKKRNATAAPLGSPPMRAVKTTRRRNSARKSKHRPRKRH